ncbi:uncharacterized protein Dwil_GK19657 [Drosophila willistoni]|uniref:MADF domain-containing protein n=1 Tax=Drosophila willistoni TaxID=7260 RepID=B4MNX5_DROWI|nr:uncharacterized protein LOC6639869 [Drosophila willistoni]EDW73814.1 uncharacterized protein Dwil_GK19657 [Drosophila willistoni]
MSAHHRPLDESDVLLIRTIRDTPSLYDPQLPSFRASHRKTEDWMKVAEILNITPTDARRRWTCLRDRYSRELKQMRLHPTSDFGRNDFFRKMDFLRDFVRKRRERNRRDRNQTPSGWLTVDMRKPSIVKVQPSSDSMIDETEANISYEESEDHNYETKMEVQSETYSVLVEADDGEEDEPEEENEDTYAEFMTDSVVGEEPTQAKVLPSLQAARNVITINPGEEIPSNTSATPTAGVSVNAQHGGHSSDLGYMVCITDQTKTNVSCTGVSSDTTSIIETEDDFFCKSVAAYLRQLSRVHKIKAKVEMYQILEKYILVEETRSPGEGSAHSVQDT